MIVLRKAIYKHSGISSACAEVVVGVFGGHAALQERELG